MTLGGRRVPVGRPPSHRPSGTFTPSVVTPNATTCTRPAIMGRGIESPETMRETDGQQPRRYGSRLVDEALSDGFGDRRCPVRDAELVIDVLKVGLDGRLAHLYLLGDLAPGASVG